MKYVMTTEGFDILTAKLEKINRKGKKLGADVIEPKNVKKIQKRVEGFDYVVFEEMIEFDLEVTAPVVDGYKIIATMDNKEDVGKNIIHMSYGIDIDAHDLSDFTERTVCDHCGYRRKRRTTYILQDAENNYIQVGKSCLSDFVKGDIRSLVHYASLEINPDEIEKEVKTTREKSGRTLDDIKLAEKFSIPFKTYLAVQIELVETEGFIKAEFGERSTAKKAWNTVMLGTQPQKIKALETEHAELMETVIEWAKSKNDATNVYLHNISVIASREVLNFKECMYAGSIYQVYKREMERNSQPTQTEKGYVGVVNENINLSVKVIKIAPFTTRQGRTAFTIFLQDSNRNELVMFANTEMFTEGEVYNISCKVTNHKVYNGKKQTQISNVNIL